MSWHCSSILDVGLTKAVPVLLPSHAPVATNVMKRFGRDAQVRRHSRRQHVRSARAYANMGSIHHLLKVVGITAMFILRRAKPIKPIAPLPNSHRAAGMGTADSDVKFPIKVTSPWLPAKINRNCPSRFMRLQIGAERRKVRRCFRQDIVCKDAAGGIQKIYEEIARIIIVAVHDWTARRHIIDTGRHVVRLVGGERARIHLDGV